MTRDEAVNLIEAHEHVVRRWAGAHHDKIEDAIAEQVASREPLIAALTAPATGEDVARSWRCFHCDEVFTDAKAAREHFGSTELDEPGCKMLAKGELELLRDYRDMAARWQRCVSEDCEASRIYHSMSAKIATTEREAEQRGYDKGLNDVRLAASRVPEWRDTETDPPPKDIDVLLFCPDRGPANPKRIELRPYWTTRGSLHPWATMWQYPPAEPAAPAPEVPQ